MALDRHLGLGCGFAQTYRSAKPKEKGEKGQHKAGTYGSTVLTFELLILAPQSGVGASTPHVANAHGWVGSTKLNEGGETSTTNPGTVDAPGCNEK